MLLLGLTVMPPSAKADNAMGYQLLSERDVARLQPANGALGLDVSRARQIVDAGMTFDVIDVATVKRGSAGERAGFREGDQIIAVNGLVFPSLRAFAAYVRSMRPGSVATVDYMPAGGGPAQAQRIAVTVGGAGQNRDPAEHQEHNGMSPGTKLAIGAGAVALFGCYELGCFSHHHKPQTEQAPVSR
jgi:hypothetical protein